MLKMGGVHEAAGNAAKAAVLRARASRGLTASERAAKAKQLRGSRQKPTLPGVAAAPAPNARAMAARLANERTPHAHGAAQADNRAWRSKPTYPPFSPTARPAYRALDLHAKTVEREQIIPGYKAHEPRAAAERMARALAGPTVAERQQADYAARKAKRKAEIKASNEAAAKPRQPVERGPSKVRQLHEAKKAAKAAAARPSLAEQAAAARNARGFTPAERTKLATARRAELAGRRSSAAATARATATTGERTTHATTGIHIEGEPGNAPQARISVARFTAARRAKAAALRAQRSARRAPAPAPAAGGFKLAQSSAIGRKSFRPENAGAGRTSTMFDMKKGDLPGQVSLMDRVGSVHTHEGTKPAPAPARKPFEPATTPESRAFAAAVNDATTKAKHRPEFDTLRRHKALIVDVYHEFAKTPAGKGMSLDQFKQKLAANRHLGGYHVGRIDMVQAWPHEPQMQSETQLMGEKYGGPTAHYILRPGMERHTGTAPNPVAEPPVKAAAAKPAKLTPTDAMAKLKDIQKRSGGMEPRDIASEVKQLSQLSVNELKGVQKQFLGANLGKSKEEMLGQLEKRIQDFRASNDRVDEIRNMPAGTFAPKFTVPAAKPAKTRVASHERGETTPATHSHADVERRVIEAIHHNKSVAGRATIADVRDHLKDVPRHQVDKAIESLQDSGRAVAYRNDNPMDLKARDHSAAWQTKSGEPRHVMYATTPDGRIDTRPVTTKRQRSTLTQAPRPHSINAHDRATAKRQPKRVKMVFGSKTGPGGPAGRSFPATGPAWVGRGTNSQRTQFSERTPAGPMAAIKSVREHQLKAFGATLFDGPNTPYHRVSSGKSAQISASSAAAAASSAPNKAVERGRRMLDERARTAARLKAAAAVKREQEHPETHGKAGKSYELDTKSIHFDPDRFQYKLAAQGSHGTTEALKDVKKWNPDLAGVVSVWKDPANGQAYVVNGHHRLDLANKLGVSKINARYIDAPNHVEARAAGAMVNIAEGRGTATDAAKFFRDRKIGPHEAAAEGVSLREHTANQGLAMAGLSDHAFKRVVNQELAPNRAAIIGGSGLTHAQQDQLLKVLDKPRNAKLSDGTVRNMVDSAKAAGSRTKTVHDLFGSSEEEEALGIHRAKAEDAIKRDLAGDKRLFSLVSKSKAAKSLEERGQSRIDTDTTGKIGHEAGAVLDVFDLLKHKDPHISKPLNEAAERIANGENPKTVHAETRAKVTARIKAILEGDVDPFA